MKCFSFFLLVSLFLSAEKLPAEIEKSKSGQRLAGQVLQDFHEISNAPSSGIYRMNEAVQKVLESAANSQQKSFFVKMLPQALDLMWEKKIPVSATVSMAIYESDYGQSGLARNYNNFFGIKAFSDWSGPRALDLPTRDNGLNTRSDFRSYKTLSESTKNYGQFLTTKKHYQDAFTAADGPEFVKKVLLGGYCPDRDYHANITTLIRRHRLLELEQVCQLAFTVSESSVYDAY